MWMSAVILQQRQVSMGDPAGLQLVDVSGHAAAETGESGLVTVRLSQV